METYDFYYGTQLVEFERPKIPEREEPRDLEQEIEELRQIIDILIGGEGNE